MSFSSEAGYIPTPIDTIMEQLRVSYNSAWSTTFTTENWPGSNAYKFLYAAAQKMQSNEVKTAEIFLKLQQYIETTNEAIASPVATAPGLVAAFKDAGYTATVKPPENADAGKIFIAVDVLDTDPDYADIKLEIATLIKESVAAGIVSQGDQVSTIVLSNGQPFDFKFKLPDRHTTKLKLTVTTSDNNQIAVGNPDDTKVKLLQNIAARYKLGLDFEPQKYFSVVDAPWASQVKLEYSLDNGTTWNTAIYEADYDDLLVVSLANVELIED